VRQNLSQVPDDPAARERRRCHVLAGAYTLWRATKPDVCIAAMGAMVTEAVEAAGRLERMGVSVEVICVTSPDLIYRAVQGREGVSDSASWVLDQVFPAERAAPMVTVLDGHPHALAFLANINRVRCKTLGVSKFGQGGDIEAVYRYHGIDADSIVWAALDLAM
jgi:pyruvate dehydrogenase E1 component